MIYPKSVYLCLLFLLVSFTGKAQQSSNAYRLEWEVQGNQQFKITALDLLTGFNENGYNNQPFSEGKNLFLSSSRNEKSASHTNIIELNLESKTIRQITNTEDAEYSPTKLNGELYFVRLDATTNYQELWKYDGHELHKVLPETNVAYFTPLSPERLAVVLIENKQLVLYDIDLKSNRKKKIVENSGRSLALSENGLLYFVHKYSTEQWYIKTYDLLTGQIKIVCKTIPEAEDFYLENERYLWMAKDQRIYRTTLQQGIATSWANIFNLEDYPLNNIGRLCVIGTDQLVFINQ